MRRKVIRKKRVTVKLMQKFRVTQKQLNQLRANATEKLPCQLQP